MAAFQLTSVAMAAMAVSPAAAVVLAAQPTQGLATLSAALVAMVW
jgi:hypothetical protein